MFSQKNYYYILILILSFCLVGKLTADAEWVQLSPATSPGDRANASMAFDPSSGKIILFGGQSNSGLVNDTWSWDGTNWTQMSPATSPSIRTGAAMAYDQGSGQLILFGGQSSSGYLADTWGWNGATWSQLFPATSPPLRSNAAMAFDDATGQLILFGGENNIALLGDTWNWNGTNWIQLAPATSPPARLGSSMAFDPATGQMILFGGVTSTGLVNDTWNWDGITWTQLAPPVSPPSRFGAALAFDIATSQLILFGGQGAGFLGDTWSWNGTSWTELFPTPSPIARLQPSMAYDPASGQMILFGGRAQGFGSLNDTWNWTLTCPSSPDWTQLTPATSPSARNGAGLAFDPSTGNIILFGGDDGVTTYNDTWSWDGTTWTQLFPATVPPSRRQTAMTHDLSTGQIILFGGISNTFLNDTWSWDGSNWTQLFPATSPPARAIHVMDFDSATGQLILFGGNDSSTFLNDTWIWNGTNWIQQFPATSPSGRTGPSMTFDAATGQLVLFGGLSSSGTLNDTWNWDGTTWTQLLPPNSPAARFGAAMAFSEATGQQILFGGKSDITINAIYFGDTWYWDGSTWTVLTPTSSPIPSFLPMMAFDQGSGQQILFGGANSQTTYLNETWNWGIASAIPVVTATPSSQSICSGNITSIGLISNVPGSVISWTVVQNGVTGASADSGASIAQTLSTTDNAAGTATYTVTAVSPGGCSGASIDVVVTVNPFPVVTATPSSQSICNGDETSIDISSNLPSTTFSWTVVESDVTGASAGTGASIDQTLNTSTNAIGTATYTITPALPGGCDGEPIDVVVTVIPDVTAIATPPAQSICAGATTSIQLSSNVPGATFSWTVVQNGVTGASGDSGTTIAQTLNTITNAAGTATYTVTPSVGDCIGDAITIIVSVEKCPPRAPRHFRGRVNYMPVFEEISNILSWSPSPSADVIGYRLYEDGVLIKTLPKTTTKITLYHRECRSYTYSLVSVNADNLESAPVTLTLPRDHNKFR